MSHSFRSSLNTLWFSLFLACGFSANATECERVEDGDLFVDKDWHISNSSVGAANGRYPDQGGTGPFEKIQQMLDVIQPGECGYVRASQEPYMELGGKSGQAMVGNTFLRGGTSEEMRIVVSGYPGERPVIDNQKMMGAGNGEAAGFLVAVGDYITIKNFEIRNTTSSSVMIHHANTNRYITVENCHLHNAYGRDNIGGVRLDWCDYCVVRNNIIHDTYESDPGGNGVNSVAHAMMAGVHGFRPSNSIIEYNLIYNVASAVFVKEPHPEGKNSNTVRYNIFHNLDSAAYSIKNMGAGLNPSFNAKFHHNLVYNALSAVDVDHYEAVGTGSGLEVYNNTIIDIDYLVQIANVVNVSVYNNLIQGSWGAGPIVAKRPGAAPRRNGFSVISHNLFYGVRAIAQFDRYLDTGVTYYTLQELLNASDTGLRTDLPDGIGAGSLTGDPAFVDPASRNYNLQAQSLAVGAGRNGETIGALGNGIRIGPESAMLALVGDNPIRKPNLTVTPAD